MGDGEIGPGGDLCYGLEKFVSLALPEACEGYQFPDLQNGPIRIKHLALEHHSLPERSLIRIASMGSLAVGRKVTSVITGT